MCRGISQRKRSRRKKHSYSAPPTLQSPKKRLKWTNESMISGVEAVKRGSSIKRAAEEHGVPRMTLQDQVLGYVEHRKTRPTTIFE